MDMKGIRTWPLVIACLCIAICAASASADPKIKFRVQIGDCITKVVYSPDGSKFAVAVAGFEKEPANEVRVFSSDDGKRLASFKSEKGSPQAVTFTRDNSFLISAADGGECIIWDLKEQNRAATLKGDWTSANCLEVSPDGKQFAVAGYEKHVEVWDLVTRKRVAKLQTGGEQIMSLSYSPESRLLAGGGWDGRIHIWEMGKLKESACEQRHSGIVRSVTFVSQGRKLISLGDHENNSDLLVWDVNNTGALCTGGELSVAGHALSMSVSPGERVVAIACGDQVEFHDMLVLQGFGALGGEVRLARLAYRCQTQLFLTSIAFHPKNSELLIGTYDGAVKDWSDVPTFKK
jgi:WD40 repeat protein